jgi:hypothetical protein
LSQIERAQHLVETARQRARRPLHMQALTSVAHHMGGGERKFLRRFFLG